MRVCVLDEVGDGWNVVGREKGRSEGGGPSVSYIHAIHPSNNRWHIHVWGSLTSFPGLLAF